MSFLDTRLKSLLEKRKDKGRFRQLRAYDTSEASGLTDFSSNDYLSLTTDADLREAYIAKLQSSPVVLGSTGSRLLSGCTTTHSQLELRLAEHFDAPSALLFNSGFDANVSFFSNAPQPGDWIVHDELIHASVHDGMRGGRVPTSHRLQFAHNDAASLAGVLQKLAAKLKKQATSAPGTTPPTVFIAMETLYSMDGDFAPIPALLDVADQYIPREQQCVVVDEAHSTGVFGLGGRGIVHALGEHLSADPEQGGRRDGSSGTGRVTVRLMTFGKGVGCSGAVLLSTLPIRQFLINFARPFIFSTAISLSDVLAVDTAWDFLAGPQGDKKRAELQSNIDLFHTLTGPILARTPPSLLRLPDPTPIPFPAQPPGAALPANPPAPIIGLLSPTPHALSAFLLERGFIARPVVPPTVPPGGERVRVCLRAGIGRDVIERLARAFGEWVERDEVRAGSVRARL